MPNKSVSAILFMVLIGRINFGLFIPDLQLRGNPLGIVGLQMGILIAIFSFSQSVFSPLFRYLSHFVGRRPILLFMVLIGFLSNYLYKNADNSSQMIFARFLSGIAASNIFIAYSIVTDFVPLSKRPLYTGLIETLMGVGFIVGAAIGALIFYYGGGKIDSLAFTGKVLNSLSLLLLIFIPKSSPSSYITKVSFSWNKRLDQLHLIYPLLLLFTYIFAITHLESTFIRLAYLVYKIDPLKIAFIFCFIGVVVLSIQKIFFNKLLFYVKEPILIKTGYFFLILSMMLLPYCKPLLPLLSCLLMLCIGRGIVDPFLNRFISKNVSIYLQENGFGIIQWVGGIARMIGPLTANMLFEIDAFYPYLFAGIVLLVVFIKTHRTFFDIH